MSSWAAERIRMGKGREKERSMKTTFLKSPLQKIVEEEAPETPEHFSWKTLVHAKIMRPKRQRGLN